MTKFYAVIHPCKRERGPYFTSTHIESMLTGGFRFEFEAANAKDAVRLVCAKQVELAKESLAMVFPAKGFRSPPGLKKMAADLYFPGLEKLRPQKAG